MLSVVSNHYQLATSIFSTSETECIKRGKCLPSFHILCFSVYFPVTVFTC